MTKLKQEHYTAKEILEKHRVLIKDAKTFPINLTRDTHIGTKEAILTSMKEVAERAFDAGEQYGYRDATGIGDAQKTKEEFINSLFT